MNLFEVDRLEAFSDAVIAIIITIMVLELRFPASPDFASLLPVVPTFLAYVLSFVFLAIYWNNHHHLLKAARGVNGVIMWANMALLFFLSLVPFFTAWMGHFPDRTAPTTLYGVVMLCAAISYYILQLMILKTLGPSSTLKKALGRDYKGKISPILYLLAIGLSFWMSYLAQPIFVIVALLWIVPDRRIAKSIVEG